MACTLYVITIWFTSLYMQCCDLKSLVCHNDVSTVVLFFFSNIRQPVQSFIPSNNQLCVLDITRAHSNWPNARNTMTWMTENLHQQPELIFSFPHLTIQSFHLISGQVGFRHFGDACWNFASHLYPFFFFFLSDGLIIVVVLPLALLAAKWN